LKIMSSLPHPEPSAEADAEREWIRKSREGDPQFYRFLVERYQARIYRLVARFLEPEHGDIEDVVQEVFTKAFFSLGRFREDSSFVTWITRIAINRAKDELKKRSNRNTLGEPVEPEWIEEVKDHVQQSDDKEEEKPEPPGALRTLVDRALAALPERLRVVVTLKDMEGLSYQEIGEVMKCSVGTVKSRHNRARKKLREILSAEFGELRR